LDLRQLRYFVAIVEERSFSKAAVALRIAQPALSLHVRNMEANLGTDLLLRTPQGIRTTPAGRILFDNARAILAQFESTKRAIVAEAGDLSGEVRIGLPGTISQILSVPLILKARELYPRVKLRVMEAMSGFILEWLRDERIDIALLYLAVDERGVKSYKVLEEELCLFGPAGGIPGVETPPGRPFLTTEDLSTIPLILPSVGHGLRMLVDERFGRGGTSLETVIDVDSYASIKECVGHALAYSILPVTAVAAEVEAGQFRSWRIGSPPLSRAVHLAHAFERPVSRAAAVVEGLCRETLTELVRSGAWQARLVLEPGPDGEGAGTP